MNLEPPLPTSRAATLGPHGGLAVAGLDAEAEAVYGAVLAAGAIEDAEVARTLGISTDAAARTLDELRAAGLVNRAAGDGRFAAVDPRVALRAVAERAEDGLARLRAAIPLLAEVYENRGAAERPGSSVGVLVGPDAVGAAYNRLEHQAVEEFMAFDRPPYVLAPLNPLEPVVIARGVRWRAVYAAAALDRPGAWDEVRRAVEAGEQARLTSDLPVKLAIADRRAALVSTRLDGLRPEAILTDSQPLVALLCEVFEAHWEQAADVPRDEPVQRGPVPVERRGPTAEERALLAFFASGAKDEVIARELHVSTRTVRRRSQLLLRRLGAANRFQAGVQAARRGWV